jgi:hypothetical protein
VVTVAILLTLITVVGLAGGLVVPLAVSLARVVLYGSIVGFVVGLVAGMIAWLTAPATGPHASTPRSALHDDWVVLAVQSIAGGFVGGLAIGVMSAMDGISWGFTWGVQIGTALAMVIAFSRTASSWYKLAHVLLALRGKLPWRLMRFLDDAHRRGILRQSGAVYQFRHAVLKDHLAGSAGEA